MTKVVALVDGQLTEVDVQTQGGGETTVLKVDNGNASTTFPEYVLRLDFGNNGASINPTGTP